MRIIAGSARGARIFAPKGAGTRPTLDRVRESLFSIVLPWLEGSRVLDLFAGSGAMALEALSRGAHEAVAVDISREAVSVIKRNAEKLRLLDRCHVVCRDWREALRGFKAEGRRFDVVFMDPPYIMENTGEMAGELARLGLIERGALIVVEHDSKTSPDMPAGFSRHGPTRRYGETDADIYVYDE